MIFCTIEKKLAVLSENGNAQKLLTITNWNNGGNKLDLRTWGTDEAGHMRPYKGLTLTDDEAEKLLDALQEYFEDDDELYL